MCQPFCLYAQDLKIRLCTWNNYSCLTEIIWVLAPGNTVSIRICCHSTLQLRSVTFDNFQRVVVAEVQAWDVCISAKKKHMARQCNLCFAESWKQMNLEDLWFLKHLLCPHHKVQCNSTGIADTAERNCWHCRKELPQLNFPIVTHT